ncbi:uncharacterized protein Gasu_58230 [Galdieria sulphuraria]|uniref:Uncharacterized protein n=1 Tax=Galdieria sulphuraria TaxID=130081 RepID=M2WRY0_GALSU|nr:uncharacterized protein Gasu_58230 [Galdieria sulphuraria]EME26590.1 hypothetical protein Gasu_58230 [Galdieria sulphuraria]|eukprot:XP_005703110.1 hypothetical protein Gasu_58230 [Galdieria sulphuraria]
MATFGKTPNKLSSPIYFKSIERKSSQLFDLATQRISSWDTKNESTVSETDEDFEPHLVKQISFLEGYKSVEKSGLGLLSQSGLTCEQLLEQLLHNRFLVHSYEGPHKELSLWLTHLNFHSYSKWNKCLLLAIAYIWYHNNDEEGEEKMNCIMNICQLGLQENIQSFPIHSHENIQIDAHLFHMIYNMDFDAWEEYCESIQDTLLKMIQSLLSEYPRMKKNHVNPEEGCSLSLSIWMITFISFFYISLVTCSKTHRTNKYGIEMIQWLSKANNLCFPEFVKDLISLCVATLLDKLSCLNTTADSNDHRIALNHFVQQSSTIWLLQNIIQYTSVAEQQRKRAICIACLRVLVNLSSNNQELCRTLVHQQALPLLIRLLHNESFPHRTDFDLRVTCLVLIINILISYPSCATLFLHITAVHRFSSDPSTTKHYSEPAIFQILLKYIRLIPSSNESNTNPMMVEHQTTVAYASILLACLINGERRWITVSDK